MNPPSPLRAAVFVAGGAFLISFAAIFARLADVAPTTSGFYRMVFGSLAFALWLGFRPALREGFGQHWPTSFLVGALFAADIWFWHRSIEFIGPGLATLLANFQVFLLTAIGVIWFRERVGWRFASGLGLAVFGLWLLFGREWAGLTGEFRLGIGLGLMTALAYALYILALRGAQIRHPQLRPETRLAQVTICCGIVLGALNLFEGHGFAIPDGQTLAALIALGVFCQVLGWLLITRGMPFLPAAIVGLLLLLQPSLSITWDFLLFNLRLSPGQLIGIALALIGIYFGFRAAARQKPPAPD